MTWTGAIVLFSMFFFLALFVLLPRGLRTQEEEGEVVQGTPRSAPAHINMGRKFLWSAVISAGIVALAALVMYLDLLTLDDLSFLFPPELKK